MLSIFNIHHSKVIIIVISYFQQVNRKIAVHLGEIMQHHLANRSMSNLIQNVFSFFNERICSY